MNKKLQALKYLIADFFSASVAWTVLYVFRKVYLETKTPRAFDNIQLDENYYYGLLFIPVFWVALYVLSGQYNKIYRRYRIKELADTFLQSLIGTICIFFVFILDDMIDTYQDYYQSLLVLFATHFGLTLIFRLWLTTRTVKKIHSGKIGFNTIIVGGNERAFNMFEEIRGMKKSPGFKFLGFVRVNGRDNLLEEHVPYLGQFDRLPDLIRKKDVEEVIIAIESSDHKEIGNILNELEGTGVNVKIIPDMYDILSGSVKMNSIFGTPLVQINREIMPAWQFSIKRIMDIFVSLVAIIILSPVYIGIALAVKFNSRGPVFFVQERIGKDGQPFDIYKFRTMVQNAEADGPQLAKENDKRVTSVGRFLRKTRLDEIPQFFNVLKGDMSLVGPRPEREFFIDKIMVEAPHYRHLQKVRPGITSWGQVKYGYAENVEQMIHRLKYDVLYIENMSLAVDLKILLYTILTVVKGDGK
jgi:exopolysaccharide biosynthesis polyprenyl glycosylphosphotransferase